MSVAQPALPATEAPDADALLGAAAGLPDAGRADGAVELPAWLADALTPPRRAANWRATRGTPALKAAAAVRWIDRAVPGWDPWVELRSAAPALRGRAPAARSPPAAACALPDAGRRC